MKKNKIYIVMGVSGVGKTSIGIALAEALQLPFFDADDYHPPGNISKMESGKPLTDKDRRPWLMQLNELLLQQKEKGGVLACSALKEDYRNLLAQSLSERIVFIYLKGDFDLIQKRLRKREGHFMPSSLLKSQFALLEPPKKAMVIDAASTPSTILKKLLNQIR